MTSRKGHMSGRQERETPQGYCIAFQFSLYHRIWPQEYTNFLYINMCMLYEDDMPFIRKDVSIADVQVFMS